MISKFAALLLLLCAGCGRPREATGTEYMLPQAQGVRLGMSYRELRSQRPGVRMDSDRITESAGRRRVNMYYFGKSGTLRREAISGPLQAIVMDEVFDATDSTRYLARADSIRNFWTIRIGTPADSAEIPLTAGTLAGTSAKMLRWQASDLSLTLVMEQTGFHELMVRSVVQRDDVLIPELALFPSGSKFERGDGLP